MLETDTLIQVQDLHTQFFLREGTVRAVDGASFTIRRGKTLGIVGESGCGKSVTAQSIMQIVPPPGKIVSGEILLHIQESRACAADLGPIVNITKLAPGSAAMRTIRGGVIGMIFQEPMSCFSPVHTVGSQLA